MDTTGKETVLYRFTGGADGANPSAGVILDAAGNLYGATEGGGVPPSDGTVFKLNSTGKKTVLYSFTGERTGLNPPQAWSGARRALSTVLRRLVALSHASLAAERCSSWIRPARRRCCTPSPVERTGNFPQISSETRREISTVRRTYGGDAAVLAPAAAGSSSRSLPERLKFHWIARRRSGRPADQRKVIQSGN